MPLSSKMKLTEEAYKVGKSTGNQDNWYLPHGRSGLAAREGHAPFLRIDSHRTDGGHRRKAPNNKHDIRLGDPVVGTLCRSMPNQHWMKSGTEVSLPARLLTTPLHLHPLLASSGSAVVSLTLHVGILTFSYLAHHSVKRQAVVPAERRHDC